VLISRTTEFSKGERNLAASTLLDWGDPTEGRSKKIRKITDEILHDHPIFLNSLRFQFSIE
jgi:hypothetical protein